MCAWLCSLVLIGSGYFKVQPRLHFVQIVSNIFLLPQLHCCISSNRFKYSSSYCCIAIFSSRNSFRVVLLNLLDQIWLLLAQVYLSFHLVSARAALKLTEALESFTIYSTRISNESLGRGPSGQTFLRTYRADYWFLTLHFIFIKWHWDLNVPKQTALSIPPILSLPLCIPSCPPYALSIPSLSHSPCATLSSSIPPSHCLNHITNNQGRVIDMNSRVFTIHCCWNTHSSVPQML